MKELSIEEKARAYDGNYKAYTELINRIEDVKEAIKKQNYGIAMDILCKPYPQFQVITHSELKESEDEKINPDSLPKDNWELIREFVNKFGRIPKDEDELNVLIEYVLKRKKPTEWSEEDKKMLESCCGAIAAADYYTYDDKQEMESWLKSLRPQNRWKQQDDMLLNEKQREAWAKGGEEMKKELMNKALDGKMVVGDEPQLVIPSLFTVTRQLDDGDKVKVIIIKES